MPLKEKKFFSITRRCPPTNICNKICPRRICAVVRIFIRSRTPFTPYTEGFRRDFGISNFFLQPKDAPLLISAIKFLPKEYARLIKFLFVLASHHPLHGRVLERFWHQQFFSITKGCPPTNICNKICRQRICAVVRMFYWFLHKLHPLYGRVPERFWHRQFFSITKRCPFTKICNKTCPQRICAVVRIFYSLSYPLQPQYGRVPERFWHRQFFPISSRGPSTHICNKIWPQRICAVVRIFYSQSHPHHPLYGRVPERFWHWQFFSTNKTCSLLTRGAPGMRVLDLAKTAGGASSS